MTATASSFNYPGNHWTCVVFYARLCLGLCGVFRGVTTAGDTGDASPVRPTMSPYIKVTTDSLSSELTF